MRRSLRPPTRAVGAGVADAAGPLAQRVQALEAEVATLRQTVAKLCAELGMSPAGQE